MLKYLIDKFRQAPGPLKQPRLIAADLAEEVVDLVSGYLKGRKDEVDYTCAPCRDDSSAEEKDPTKEAQVPAPAKKPEPKAQTVEEAPELDLDPELAAAMKIPGNKRKQEFKVLAILWDAKKRETGPLSAKSIAQHGDKMGLSIRHENVRKVIRMRLEKYVEVHAEGVGSGTIYRYEMASSGADYFTGKYLE